MNAADSLDRPPLADLPDFSGMSPYEFNCWLIDELMRQQAQLRDLRERIDGLAAKWREAEGDGR